jgi:tRNA pseudouridine13 synthase
MCGDYRKLICKPSDITFEVREYHDPLQPLLQTDLMKVNDIDVNSSSLCISNGKENHIGMTIGFTLPPSSYATVALRELTKRPTSSEYQSKLEVSGECERNIITLACVPT